MSFSGKVKDELLERYPTARHCMLAELAAITFCCGRVSWENNNIQNMEIYTENEIETLFALLTRLYAGIENLEKKVPDCT